MVPRFESSCSQCILDCMVRPMVCGYRTCAVYQNCTAKFTILMVMSVITQIWWSCPMTSSHNLEVLSVHVLLPGHCCYGHVSKYPGCDVIIWCTKFHAVWAHQWGSLGKPATQYHQGQCLTKWWNIREIVWWCGSFIRIYLYLVIACWTDIVFELHPLCKAIQKKSMTRLDSQHNYNRLAKNPAAPGFQWTPWSLMTCEGMVLTPCTHPTTNAEDLTDIRCKYQELYTWQDLHHDPIHSVVSFDIPNNILEEKEIGKTLKTLQSGWTSGPSGMTIKDLKRWYANRKANPYPWSLTIDLVQYAFWTGIVPTLVIIPKQEARHVHGICLLEPHWKLISAIINIQLMTTIQFHDDLHGYLPGHGTGTACLEAKLEAQFAFCSGRVLFHVYLDFAKIIWLAWLGMHAAYYPRRLWSWTQCPQTPDHVLGPVHSDPLATTVLWWPCLSRLQTGHPQHPSPSYLETYYRHHLMTVVYQHHSQGHWNIGYILCQWWQTMQPQPTPPTGVPDGNGIPFPLAWTACQW